MDKYHGSSLIKLQPHLIKQPTETRHNIGVKSLSFEVESTISESEMVRLQISILITLCSVEWWSTTKDRLDQDVANAIPKGNV